MRSAFPILAATFATLSAFAGDSWPQFRGPLQNGVSDSTGLPLTWSEDENIKWKTEIPGEGWSSPIVANGQVWLTTALDSGHSLRALCIEFATGKILRDIEVFKNDNPPAKHARNSYASPTGLLDGDRLFVHFGSMGTACLDTKTGAILWKNHELIVDFQNGAGGSLAATKDKLLIPCDGMDFQYEVALDKATGKIVWKSERSAGPELQKLPADLRKAYGTPVLMQIDGKLQSLTTASNRLYALDPESGQEIWHFDYPRGFSNVPLPVSDGKVLVVSSGFMKPVMYGVKLGGSKGDVTQSHLLWKQPAGGPDQSSPSIVNDRVYMTSNGGILSCLNLQTGEIVWKERIGSDFAASPIFADGRLYFFAAAGPCTVIEPGDTFKKVAENTLSAGCMASPAVVGKAFIVRTKTHLYRIEKPDAGATAPTNEIRLQAKDAVTHGEMLRYEPQPQKNTLGYWTRVEDWAEWKFDVPAAGKYEVEILQGCGKGSGGAEVAIDIGGKTLAFTVQDTGHFQNFVQRKIGIVDLPAGPQTLTVKPKTKPGVAVMDLRSVALRRAE